jgi:hypothetical protein
MFVRSFIVLSSLIAFSTSAVAWSDLDSIGLSSALGRVIASETACHLSYKQDAIKKFIDTKVPADDLNFVGHLEMGINGSRYSLKQMSESAKTAHCRQIERVAKAYGFI